ncbi:unnamed protein product [Phytomonas sp. EM1]|nr:unnamed protein product [Phytomonas sp. EM1]|eukprot:CCW60696.1 unnamed protein product [Phytomonas sp. isolate EM1]
MEFVYSLPVVSPRDALAFIYESGKSSSPRSPKNTSRDNLPKSEVDQPRAAPISSNDHETSTTQTPPVASPSFPYLEMLLTTENDHRCEAASYSSSLITNESEPDELPMEVRAAHFHTAFELVEGVIEQVICDRNTPVQRYRDALRQYILGSTMPTALVNKALDLSSSTSTDAPDPPLQLHSPKYYYGSLTAYTYSGEETDNKKRQVLLHRYEKHCENLGVVPVSSVMARMAPEIDNRTFTSLAFDYHQSFTLPPTLNSSNTHICRSTAELQPSSSIVSLMLPSPSIPFSTKELSTPDTLKRNILISAASPAALPQGDECIKSFKNTDSQYLTSTNMASREMIPPSNEIRDPSGVSDNLGTTNDNATSSWSHGGGAGSPKNGTAPWMCSHTASHVEPAEEHCELDFTSCEGIGRVEDMVPLFRALEGYPEVTLLSLAGTGLDDAGVRVLALLCEAFLSSLRSLDLRNNPLITDISGPFLRSLLQRRRTLHCVQTSGSGMSSPWIRTIDILSRRNAA